jgi:glycosyltransferase involved in cell wall biosynthesis
MKKILATAYAMNPFQGSEGGTGWQFTLQIARFNNVVVVTRINNKESVDTYLASHPELKLLSNRIEFIYFDWPKWMIFWKKGPNLSMIYFYAWQLSVAVTMWKRRKEFDIVHNLNFHNDWTPSFLWILGKPMVWGPVGHNPKVPKAFITNPYGRFWWMNRIKWATKKIFWVCDPFLKIARKKAAVIIVTNNVVKEALKSYENKVVVIPAVASTRDQENRNGNDVNKFIVLCAGHFIQLKGFDIVIRSFAFAYHHHFSEKQRSVAQLVLIGKGNQENFLKELVKTENIQHAVRFISWLPKDELAYYYQHASVFFFATHEGAGMVVAEAMNYGLPVLCFDNSGPGQLVHPESTLKVPYRSYESAVQNFAEKLYLLNEHPSLREKESQLSLKRFDNYLDWELRGGQLNTIYNSILVA